MGIIENKCDSRGAWVFPFLNSRVHWTHEADKRNQPEAL